MKIIKHSKTWFRKTYPDCGCEFEGSFNDYQFMASYKQYWLFCPECCHMFETVDKKDKKLITGGLEEFTKRRIIYENRRHYKK